jgi:hypothetical protein
VTQHGQGQRLAIAGLRATVACDVKHIHAWGQENHAEASVADRYTPAPQPPGDLDCRLGVNPSSNQVQAAGTTTATQLCVWGQGRGVAAAITNLQDLD